MSLVFRVNDVSFNADWTLQTAHVCSSGGCGTNFVLKWNPERAGIYGEVLADSTVMQDQFAQALEERDYEKACFCRRSMIVHAASDFRVGMGKQISVCAPLCGKNKVRDPPWFDAHCKEKRHLFRTAVQDGQAVHACKFAKKEYRVQTRRAKRA
jgi:hypothetical protein